ncbi:thiopeptide-type bacteriocin biosynthesis protein [Dactylosporangium sp. CA-233914]|uniref:thiopeptide-type bacteriocin biosynthesis protein n=1 Tax=Dactylosporangium sp. CA-233914 TaxID=3239934 RepID=UPI003D93FD8D
MDEHPWQQVNINYPGPTPEACEQHAVAHLSRVLPAAETAGLITGWWFIRKGAWRIRYLPADNHSHQDRAHQLLTNGVTWTTDIYEPETHAFGGTDAMAAAHRLFHRDSRHLLTHLGQHATDRRERSLILCTALMRAAALDLNEQGDVWAKALEHRARYADRPTTVDQDTWEHFTSDTRRLLLGNPRTRDDWHTAFADAGTDLRRLRETGKLTRGLRDVIALHVIFHWNRMGLPAQTQATLAQAAKEAVFGSAPAPLHRQ